MLGTLLHLDCNIAIVLKILCEPHSREVSPTKLLDNDVAIKQNFSNMDWVIASYLVIRHALILT